MRTKGPGPTDVALRRRALALFAFVVVVDVGYVLASRGLNHQPGLEHTAQFDIGEAFGVVAPGCVGLLLTWARPHNRIGWLITATGVCLGLGNLGQAYGERSVAFPDEHLPGGMWAMSLSAPLWVWAVFLPPTLLLVRYPSGVLAGPWARRLERSAVAGGLTLWLGYATSTNSVSDEITGGVPPLRLPDLVGMVLGLGGALVLIGSAVAICLEAVVRAVRGERAERLALVWLVTTTVLMVVVVLFGPVEWLGSVAFFGILGAVAVGVLRYRALGIEVAVRRTLVYTILTGLVLLVFVGVVTALARVVPSGPTPQLVAAALIAVGLAPARDRIQSVIDRLLYGERDDPFAALTRLGSPMGRNGQLLPGVLGALADSLHVEGAYIAAPGSAGVPLLFGGQELGRLQVLPRRGETALGKADQRLVESVAPLIAAVLNAVQATEFERHRLRQELHDGLGPSLTGIGLGLEAAQRSGATEELLTRLRTEVTLSLEEVHRIIDDLRPSALDNHDLLSALQRRTEQVTSHGGVSVQLKAPSRLPDLPPPVAAAAFRIADEALTNVVRHAGALHCTVELSIDDGLHVEVSDDGVGPGDARDGGVGLSSMRERAERLGGSFTMRDTQPGTSILACLPLGAA